MEKQNYITIKSLAGITTDSKDAETREAISDAVHEMFADNKELSLVYDLLCEVNDAAETFDMSRGISAIRHYRDSSIFDVEGVSERFEMLSNVPVRINEEVFDIAIKPLVHDGKVIGKSENCERCPKKATCRTYAEKVAKEKSEEETDVSVLEFIDFVLSDIKKRKPLQHSELSDFLAVYVVVTDLVKELGHDITNTATYNFLKELSGVSLEKKEDWELSSIAMFITAEFHKLRELSDGLRFQRSVLNQRLDAAKGLLDKIYNSTK